MKWPTLIFLTIFNIQLARGINVAGMLDFSEPKPKIIERVYVAQKEKTVADKNKNDNSGERKIGVICASGGCNTTGSVGVEGSDTISADVVVAVKTSLNANEGGGGKKTAIESKDKSDANDEIPDVPVVIGYGGVSDLPRSHIIPPDNQLNPNPILVSDIERRFPELGTPHVRGGNNGFLPSLGVSIEFKPQDNLNTRYPNNYHRYNVDSSPQGPWKHHNTAYRPTPELTFFGKPLPWYRRDYVPTYRTTPRPSDTWTKCECHPNSVWNHYTTTPSYINFNHPGKQINDKLAPLV